MLAESITRGILQYTTELLLELCAVSSASGQPDGLRSVAVRLAAELGRFGLRCEIAEEVGSGGDSLPVLTARGPAADPSRLLLVGHLDTVLSAIPPRIEGNRLVGTGALDMKAGLVMLVGALDLMARRGQRPPEDLTFLAVPDEELTGTISQRVTRRCSEGARALLVLEPGAVRNGIETLVAGRRGLSEWQLEVTGLAAHSGLAFWSGRSAAAAAADWCLQAHRLSLPGPGRTVNVSRVVAGTADFVDDLGANHGLLGSSSQRNVVSDRAIADGEVRYLSTADGATVMAELADLASRIEAEHGVEARLTVGTTAPPVDPGGPGEALIRRSVELAGARGLALVVETDRGGISFPNYLANTSQMPVVDGLGPVGDGMHTRDEWVDLRSLERRTLLLADLLATL